VEGLVGRQTEAEEHIQASNVLGLILGFYRALSPMLQHLRPFLLQSELRACAGK
jgi:hypothetical protein